MILWGPPGTGKTTLARLIARRADARVHRALGRDGRRQGHPRGGRARAATCAPNAAGARVLFLDEVHRFNKAQQDAFLPYVEDGTLTFIGATTENPSFEVISALLSRARVYVLRSLQRDGHRQTTAARAGGSERGLGERRIEIADEALVALAHARRWRCAPRARTCSSSRPISREPHGDVATITIEQRARSRRPAAAAASTRAASSSTTRSRRCTRRCAAPIRTRALYWFCRMLDGGCDPHYLARRIVRMASRTSGSPIRAALQLALDAWRDLRAARQPGRRARARAMRWCFSRVAPKSNAVYAAFGEAMADVEQFGTLDVPLRFRNAPTKLMKDLGYGEGYRYAHDEPDAFVDGRALSSRRDAGPALLSARAARSRDQDRRSARAAARRRPRRARRNMSWLLVALGRRAGQCRALRRVPAVAGGARRLAGAHVHRQSAGLVRHRTLIYVCCGPRRQRRQCAPFLDDRRARRVHHLLGVRAGNRAARLFGDRRSRTSPRPSSVVSLPPSLGMKIGGVLVSMY